MARRYYGTLDDATWKKIKNERDSFYHLERNYNTNKVYIVVNNASSDVTKVYARKIAAKLDKLIS